jgi:tRNA(Ser,Leu) C12 N-acetylase TAN1
MYDFNFLVSCPWSAIGKAKREIARILELLGDEEPLIRSTIARGIIGVRTNLDQRDVIQRLKVIFDTDPSLFQFTFKWVPIDSWVKSDIESMKIALEQLKGRDQARRTLAYDHGKTSLHPVSQD